MPLNVLLTPIPFGNRNGILRTPVLYQLLFKVFFKILSALCKGFNAKVSDYSFLNGNFEERI